MNYLETNAKISGDVVTYAEKYKIRSLFSRMLQNLVVHKPEDPLSFLHNFLTKYTGNESCHLFHAQIVKHLFAFSAPCSCVWRSRLWQSFSVRNALCILRPHSHLCAISNPQTRQRGYRTWQNGFLHIFSFPSHQL